MPRTRNVDPIDPVRAKLAVAVAAMEFGVPTLDLSGGPGAAFDTAAERGSPLMVFARQVAIYLTYCSYGLNFTRIGELFGLHRTTVSHAIRVIEEGRTDPLLDAKIDRLEGWLCEVCAA